MDKKKREVLLWLIPIALTIVCAMFTEQLSVIGQKLTNLSLMNYLLILLIVNTVLTIYLITKIKKWMDNGPNINHPNKPI